jgi:hypothetical protein
VANIARWGGWAAGAVAVAAWACGGSLPHRLDPSLEGANTPEQAVERFLAAAADANRARRAGQLTLAEQHYERMALVFGTEAGSIYRRESARAVRDRMIALAGLLDPQGFRVQPNADPRGMEAGRTTITVELARQGTARVVPFSVVRGRGGRWFVDRIDMRGVTG